MKTQYQLGDHNYAIGKINPMKQFHIVRRLLPAMATVGLSVAQLKELKNLEDLASLLAPLSGVAAAMSDTDAEYVIFTCLAAVQRVEADGRGANVIVPGENRLMFEDIGMPQMLILTFQVIRENMGGFLQELSVITGSLGSSAPTVSASTP